MKLLIIFLFICSISYSQVFSEKDVEICNNVFHSALSLQLSHNDIGDVAVEVGKSFLGTEYEAYALEVTDSETLVINLTGLDCTTFLENVVVFSRLIKKGKTTFEDYKNELTFVRYRDGILKDYTSRLHYFSDWIDNNEKKGVVTDITKKIGGHSIRFNTFYMSKFPDKYKHLSIKPELVPIIKAQEEEINKREYFYIPKHRIKDCEKNIQSGDLIAITTKVDGLDIGHVGIAIKVDERIHFMHAPLIGSKVEITTSPLAEYMAKNKSQTGIIVLRLNEP